MERATKYRLASSDTTPFSYGASGAVSVGPASGTQVSDEETELAKTGYSDALKRTLAEKLRQGGGDEEADFSGAMDAIVPPEPPA
jgi:hypothetical protein